MSDDEIEDLPDEPDELYSIATDGDEFPYKREAAIKKLATCGEGDEQLNELADGGALTAIEQTLATSKLEELE